MRVGYLFMAVGLVLVKWPLIINGTVATLPVYEGVVAVLLTAMSLLAFLGLRYPVAMLPVLMFEVGWKVIWMAVVGIPNLAAGDTNPQFTSVFFNVCFGVVVLAVTPWDYVWKRFVRAPGTRGAKPWTADARHDNAVNPPLSEPNRYARIGGALYLVIIVAGIVGPLVTREALIVAHDAVATAHNIAASPGLWRLGIALDLVAQLCDVPVMVILFLLLSPVNKTVALVCAPVQRRPNIDAGGEPADARRRGAPVP